MLDLAKRFCETFGVSGHEDPIRTAIREEIDGLVDEVHVDTLGNLVALRRGSGGGKRVMLAAHMDQIGLVVTYITDKGYLHFAPVGFLFGLACWGAQVRFADGTVGTIALDGAFDWRSKVPSTQEMYVDVGASTRAEVKVQVGDVAGFARPFVAQGDAWFAPNMDDRIGCTVLVQLLHELKGREIAHDVYAVFTTQEEIGPRGAATSAYAINPDLAVALDVTDTGDTPHTKQPMDVLLGRGAAIKMRDAGMVGHPALNRQLIAAAEAANVPYQLEVLESGTTDAYSIQVARAGIPVSCISLPSRHIHLPSQIVDRRDAEGSVAILASLLSREIEL